jgi:hypothetical protein
MCPKSGSFFRSKVFPKARSEIDVDISPKCVDFSRNELLLLGSAFVGINS